MFPLSGLGLELGRGHGAVTPVTLEALGAPRGSKMKLSTCHPPPTPTMRTPQVHQVRCSPPLPSWPQTPCLEPASVCSICCLSRNWESSCPGRVSTTQPPPGLPSVWALVRLSTGSVWGGSWARMAFCSGTALHFFLSELCAAPTSAVHAPQPGARWGGPFPGAVSLSECLQCCPSWKPPVRPCGSRGLGEGSTHSPVFVLLYTE